MGLKTRRIIITFTVGRDTSEENLMRLCKSYRSNKYEVNDRGDFELSFSLNTVLEYNEVIHFMELIHMDMESNLTLQGIKYKGMRWTPNEAYYTEGTE